MLVQATRTTERQDGNEMGSCNIPMARESIPCETFKILRYRMKHETKVRSEMQRGMMIDMATVCSDSTNQHGTTRTK